MTDDTRAVFIPVAGNQAPVKKTTWKLNKFYMSRKKLDTPLRCYLPLSVCILIFGWAAKQESLLICDKQ